jgi:hypothetical protein
MTPRVDTNIDEVNMSEWHISICDPAQIMRHDSRTGRIQQVVQATINGLVIDGLTLPWRDIYNARAAAYGAPGAAAALRREMEDAT